MARLFGTPGVAGISSQFDKQIQRRSPFAYDGDPDMENATDLVADSALSSFAFGFADGRGPRCEISDPDEAVDDRPCDELFQDLEYESGPTHAAALVAAEPSGHIINRSTSLKRKSCCVRHNFVLAVATVTR